MASTGQELEQMPNHKCLDASPPKDIMLHDLQRNIHIIYFVTHDTFYDTNIFVDYIYCVPTRVMREIRNQTIKLSSKLVNNSSAILK